MRAVESVKPEKLQTIQNTSLFCPCGKYIVNVTEGVERSEIRNFGRVETVSCPCDDCGRRWKRVWVRGSW